MSVGGYPLRLLPVGDSAGGAIDLPTGPTQPAPPIGLLRRGRPWCRGLLRSWYRVRLHGAEWVPRTGPVILAANHVGLLDGPVLAVFTPRPVHMLTKVEMFQGSLGTVLRAAGQIAVDRAACDVVAVRTSLAVLGAGRALGIFPEGVRGDGELQVVRPGVAYFALVTGAPVVPVALFGTRDPGRGRDTLPARGAELDVVYGEPLTLARLPRPRTKTQVELARGALQAFLRDHLATAGRATGNSLPGPPPSVEDDPEGATR